MLNLCTITKKEIFNGIIADTIPVEVANSEIGIVRDEDIVLCNRWQVEDRRTNERRSRYEQMMNKTSKGSVVKPTGEGSSSLMI